MFPGDTSWPLMRGSVLSMQSGTQPRISDRRVFGSETNFHGRVTGLRTRGQLAAQLATQHHEVMKELRLQRRLLNTLVTRSGPAVLVNNGSEDVVQEFQETSDDVPPPVPPAPPQRKSLVTWEALPSTRWSLSSFASVDTAEGRWMMELNRSPESEETSVGEVPTWKNLNKRRGPEGEAEYAQTWEMADFLEFMTGRVGSTESERKKTAAIVKSQVGFVGLDDSEETPFRQTVAGCIAWNPDSWSRTMFDLISMLLLLYDAFTIPLILAWDIGNSKVWSTGSWATRIFWSLDVCLSFVTGYRTKDGELQLDIKVTATRFLKCWFIVDFSLVVCDWLNFHGSGASIRFMRAMRLVRGARQLLRVRPLLQKAKVAIAAKAIHLTMDISLMLLLIFWVTHVISCIWYVLGRSEESDTGETWLSQGYYAAYGIGYEYTTALHWSITQLTPGSMEVVPKSSAERVYNVVVLFFGMVLGSSLVATLSSMMTQYRLEVEERSKNFWQLQNFLRQNNVNPHLAMSIKMQVRCRMSEKALVKMSSIEYLSLVSKSTQDQLKQYLVQRPLSAHPFWSVWSQMEFECTASFCNKAVQSSDQRPGDFLFHEFENGQAMLFLLHGRLRYYPGEDAPESGFEEDDERLVLDCGAWCCEVALWLNWEHLGSALALTTCEVMAISLNDWKSELGEFPEVAQVLVHYGIAYHRAMNEPLTIVSDLSYDIDYFELISGLPQKTRKALSSTVVDRFCCRALKLDKTKLDRLDNEVKDGKCDISLSDSEPVRTVFVVALRIEDRSIQKEPTWAISQGDTEEIRYLVRMGEVDRKSGQIITSCVLPGTKRREQETSAQAVERCVQTDLEHIAADLVVNLRNKQCAVELTKSPSYGIRTRYLRTTYDAYITKPIEMLEVLRAPTSFVDSDARWNLFWPQSVKEGRRLAAEVLAKVGSVFLMASTKNETRQLYTWLTQEECQILSTEHAAPVLKQWTQQIKVPKILESLPEHSDRVAELPDLEVCPTEDQVTDADKEVLADFEQKTV